MSASIVGIRMRNVVALSLLAIPTVLSLSAACSQTLAVKETVLIVDSETDKTSAAVRAREVTGVFGVENSLIVDKP